MDRALAITVALAHGLGVHLGQLDPRAVWPAGVGLLVMALVAVVRPPIRVAPGLVVAALSGGALAGAGDAGWQQHRPEAPTAPFVAEVHRVRLKAERVEVVLSPRSTPGHRVRVRLDHRPPGLAPGATVRAAGRLRALPPADEPGGWDAAAAGRRDRIAWRLHGAVDVVRPAEPPHALALGEAARRQLAASRHPFGAAVLSGLLLGDRAAVPVVARDALQAVGAGHLMAVSGLHVGGFAAAVVLIVGGLVRRAGVVAAAPITLLVAAPAVLGLVLLAQAPLSACRAGLMVGAWLVGRALGRRPDPMVLLAWAAVVLMALQPSAAASAGFQLSFGAVAALLWFGGRRGPTSAALAAVIAAAATAPVEAWHFGTVAPVAPLANLLMCPVVALALVPAGLLGLALTPLTPVVLDLAAVGAEALVAVAEVLADTSGGSQIVGRWAAPAVAVPLVLLVGLRARRPAASIVIAFALGLVALTLRPTGTRIDFLPVGQGDAVLVRSAGRALLVDAGPGRTGFRLIGALQRAGVRRLDHVFVSHGHPDHFAALSPTVAVLPVGTVWFNGRHPSGSMWRHTVAALETAGVPLVAAFDHRFRFGDAVITVRAPIDAMESENDASVVLRVDGPAASALLTGDIERRAEAALLRRPVRPVAVLKAPHHGSRTSSTSALLDAACPSAVVFTVGRHNRHGLPHPAIVERYAARGIDRWRTDHHGRIAVHLDDPPTLEPWRGERRPLAPPTCAVSPAARPP